MKSQSILKEISDIEQKYKELKKKIQEALEKKDYQIYKELSKEFANIQPIYQIVEKLKKIDKELKETEVLMDDKELKELAAEEYQSLLKKKQELLDSFKKAIKKEREYEGSSVIVEIRAGTGGQEASLFAADLFRMYLKYAQKKNWKIQVMDSMPTDLGGFKEIIFNIQGKGVWERLKKECGVHRVQRVPVTEASGRIHTSSASVCVLQEPKEIEIKLNPNELKIETFRASGPGGQHVNVTESAVRITHIPTGIVASCQDDRSQHKNKEKALRILKARLKAHFDALQQQQITEKRKEYIKTGDRSEKIRTYNFIQNRLTDHRINLSLYNLKDILDGQLDELLDKLNEN